MRFSKLSMALSATVLLGTSGATLAAQEPVKVAVSIPASHTVWYADPFWLGMGAVAVLIILVLAVMASRKGDTKSTTTVIR